MHWERYKNCSVAEFHLFVYSISNIILNKLPLEICLVSWDGTTPRGSRHTGSTYQLLNNWDKIEHCRMISICQLYMWVTNVSQESWTGEPRTNCVPHVTQTIMNMIFLRWEISQLRKTNISLSMSVLFCFFSFSFFFHYFMSL